jgi:hypothetical protein
MTDKINPFMDWWFKIGQFKCKKTRLENARLAWDASVESTKTEKRFGCHLAAHRGRMFIYSFCMHDDGHDCMWGLEKNGCEYWREIEG